MGEQTVHRAAMAAVWKHTIQGDPRREDLVQPYKRVPVKEEDQDPDFRALASLGLGMAGLFTKNQYFSWGALFSAVSALLHGTPRSEYEAGHNGTDVFPVRTCELVH